MHDFHNDALCDSSMLKQIKLIQEDNIRTTFLLFMKYCFHKIENWISDT